MNTFVITGVSFFIAPSVVFYRPLATNGLPAFDTFSFRIVRKVDRWGVGKANHDTIRETLKIRTDLWDIVRELKDFMLRV